MSVKASSLARSNNSLRTNSGQLLRETAMQNIMTKNSSTGFQHTKHAYPDPKNTAVISFDELQRIKQQCSMGNHMDQEQRTMQRLTLQEKSNARVANWPNTIEALRRKKDEDRIKRLEEEEIERRKIDAMEYELQVQARQHAIERANKHMHDGQDQVKAFHTKMLMCDVMQERDVQGQLKKRKQEIEREIERQWQELEHQKLNEYDDNLRAKLMEEYNKKMKNAKFIKDQLLEFKMNCIKRFQEEQLEGELIRRQSEEELNRERQRDHERRLKMIDQRDSFKKANEELIAHSQIERAKEIQHEQRIAEYAKKKEALDKLRRDKEEQKFQEKQETRQRLIDRQIEHLKTVKNKEDEILNKQVAEAEEKAMKLFEEQERRRLQMKEAIEKSRQQQINKRIVEKEQNKAEEQEFTEFWKIRNEELAIAEQQEKEETRMRHEDLANFLKRQTDVRTKQAEETFKRELDAQAKAQALLDHNEKQFYSYAEQCIKDWQDTGKNVKPLILELKTYKKRLVS